MTKGIWPSPPFHSCPSKNGMCTAELGIILYTPFYTQLPDIWSEGHPPPDYCRDTSYLGNLGFKKEAGGDATPLQVEVSFY